MENRKDKLRIYLEEQRVKILPEIKEREIWLKTDGDLINDIVGPRRSGKTYLMMLTIKKLLEKVKKEAIIYINFESRKLFPLEEKYFNDLIEIIHEEELLDKFGRLYLFLDEVQKIKNWEKYLRSIYDEFKGKIKIFISGSTSKLTKSKLNYLLTGRHLTTVVFPLSFKEFLKFKGFEYGKIITEEKKAKIEKFLREYLMKGGFPEAVLSDNEEIIETLFLDIITKDIMPKVKNKEIIEEMGYFLCSYAARLTSFSKLSNILKERNIKISVPTLEKYFWLMKDSFLFFDIQIFSYKIKEQLQYPRKIYCLDNGFINYFGFKFSEDKGRIMENCAAIHLFKKSLKKKKIKIFYWKSKDGKEVDFVMKEGLKIKHLIQVCSNLKDYDTKKREIKALLKASKELKCKNLLVITEDYEAEEIVEGKKVKFIPLWKWLLQEQE